MWILLGPLAAGEADGWDAEGARVSEQRDITTSQLAAILLFCVVALTLMILFSTKVSSDRIRDLQRRVDQLESERR